MVLTYDPHEDDDYVKTSGKTLKNRQTAANQWFSSQIKGLSLSKKMTPELLLANSNRVKEPLAGQMIFFQYDAKYKDTLPYWDMFPLSFVLDVNQNSFLNLNIHYLPPSFRRLLVNKVMDTITDKRLAPQTRANVSYDTIAGASKLEFSQFAIKRHLFSHIKSKIIRMDPKEWHFASDLNIARWQKKTSSKVYSDFSKFLDY